MDENIKHKKVGKPKESDYPKLSKRERKKKLDKAIAWDQYYSTGKGRRYRVGETKYNPCQCCANNSYNSFGDEEYCFSCREHDHFEKLTKLLTLKIKILSFLNKNGIYARQKKDWPYFKIDK